VLVPDFRGRLDIALDILAATPPDVMNHNMETVPRLYKQARPGADYAHSLELLKAFRARVPNVPTKSGLMVGLGETDEEILDTLRDLRAHDVEMLTIGQYLAPSGHHLPVLRYVHPDVFAMYAREAEAMGFTHAASAPLVRSSYHADMQAHGAGVRPTSVTVIETVENPDRISGRRELFGGQVQLRRFSRSEYGVKSRMKSVPPTIPLGSASYVARCPSLSASTVIGSPGLR
jgi:hypothetical protein